MHAFFVTGLGLCVDPRPAERTREASLLWCRMGFAMFHIPADSTDDSRPCDQIAGSIELLVPRGSLERFATSLCDFSPSTGAARNEKYVSVVAPCCPIRLVEADAETEQAIAAEESSRAGHPPSASSVPWHPIALHRLCVNVGASELPGIADFFARVLGAEVALADDKSLLTVFADAPGQRQRLEFITVDNPPPHDSGTWHLALYIDDFLSAFDRALADGLIFDNPRFSDRGGTRELAAENAQFRTLHLGKGGRQLELEIRSNTHPSCPLGARASVPVNSVADADAAGKSAAGVSSSSSSSYFATSPLASLYTRSPPRHTSLLSRSNLGALGGVHLGLRVPQGWSIEHHGRGGGVVTPKAWPRQTTKEKVEDD